MLERHDQTLQHFDQMLRGNGGPGLGEQVRTLSVTVSTLANAVPALQRSDVFQSALADGMFRLFGTAITVAITVAMVKLMEGMF